MSRRMRDAGKLTLLLLVALGLRVGFTAVTGGVGRAPVFHYEYRLVGERLLEHGTIVSPLILDESSTAPSSQMPPAYAALVAAIFRMFGPDTTVAIGVLQIINALAGTLAVWLSYLVARDLGGPVAGWVAGLATTINPLLFGYTHYIWDTCLFTLGAALTLWWTHRLYQRTPSPAKMLVFGVWLGLLALLNPALTIAYPVFVLWPLLAGPTRRPRRILLGVVAAVLGWAIAVTPWTVRNYMHFGDLRYIRGGLMLEVWLGVCPEADTAGVDVYKKQFPLPENKTVRDHVAAIGEEAFYRECGVRAVEAIRADPVRYLRLSLVRMADYWLGTIFTHAEPGAGGWPPALKRAFLTVCLIVELVVLLGCLGAAGRPRREVLWLLAVAILFSIIYCLTHVMVRYRAPTEPFIAIAVGMLVEQIINRRRMRIAEQ